ncbi:MAG: hypothetical protein AABM29_07045 [Actinomycetota bacterium]
MMRLSREEAERLTAETRRDAAALWPRLLRLYEGNAHEALGYTAWDDYCAAEFGWEHAHAYRVLHAAKVQRALRDIQLDTEDLKESQARVLWSVMRRSKVAMLRVAQAALETDTWKTVTAQQLEMMVTEIAPPPPGVRRRPTGEQLELLLLGERLNETASALANIWSPVSGRRDEVEEWLTKIAPRYQRKMLDALTVLRSNLDLIERVLIKSHMSERELVEQHHRVELKKGYSVSDT